jgi:hypothetical protein
MSRPSPRTATPPCLPLYIKDLLKEDARGSFWLLAFGFLMWEALEGKRIAEGKRISEGKRIAEGKMNC